MSEIPQKQIEAKQKDSQKGIQKYTREKVKEIMLKLTLTGDVNDSLDKLADGLLLKYEKATSKQKDRMKDEITKQASAVMYGFESETHVALMESFSKKYQGGAKEICKQFIHDFDCKSDFEKILAETAAIAFMRYLDTSRRLNGCMDVAEFISDERTRYLLYLSKQMDRSHRQYLSTVSMLKQIKAPTIEMNIKTKNTFVAQNQQINATNPTESNKNEINEAK